MTIFELVKTVLDGIYADCIDIYKLNADTEIKNRIAYLSSAYNNLNKPTFLPISYKDPATRFAYVFKYVPAHADYIVQILKNLRVDGPIFTQQDLRVSCIGGGPGSDLVGILKYLDVYRDKEPVKNVTAYMLDKEQAWADTWTELKIPLNLQVSVHSAFQPFDVTKPDSWQNQKKFLQADLFTLSYFVSEVKALDVNGALDHFWDTLLKGAKSGSYILYDDNAHSDFTDYFDGKWSKAGFECILSDEGRFTPSSTEQASELASYREKFGQASKLQAQLAYRVLRKN